MLNRIHKIRVIYEGRSQVTRGKEEVVEGGNDEKKPKSIA